jgi:hypothetical protein
MRSCTAVHTAQQVAETLAIAAGLSACTVLSLKPQTQAADAQASLPAPRPTATLVDEEGKITPQTPAVLAYRRIAADHIYKAYPQRIYKGEIPPLVYAVVVVETHLDAAGKVTSVTFDRVPSHAPEVPPMIAQLIQKASPLPNPGAVGAHTYVDIWLWDLSEKFQLVTLTEGQRSH